MTVPRRVVCVIGVIALTALGASCATDDVAVSVDGSTAPVSTTSLAQSQAPVTSAAAQLVDAQAAEAQQQAERFCGLAARSFELVSESYGADSQEPFDRQQAALFAAMAPIAPESLAGVILEMESSYSQILGLLYEQQSVSTAEYERLYQAHLGLSSQVQVALIEYLGPNCDPLTADTDFVATILASADEAEEPPSTIPESAASPDRPSVASPATDTDEAALPPPPPPPPPSSDLSAPPPPGGGLTDLSQMPLASGINYPFDTPELPAPVTHGIPTGWYSVASTTWEETPERPAVKLEIYMHVSTTHIAVGATCQISAADYERWHQVHIDIAQTQQTTGVPSAFTAYCGPNEAGGGGGGGGELYFNNKLGWRQHDAAVSATFTERGTGLTATVTGTVRFADYWR